MLDAHNGHSIEQRGPNESLRVDVLFEGVKFSTERVHSVTFFAPVCPPQLDETGKDLLGLVNSTFSQSHWTEDKALNMK